MLSYLNIIRPVNLVIILLTQSLLRFCVMDTYFGLSLATSAFPIVDFILLVLSTILIAAGGYVINDYFDQQIDQTNKPEKVIAGTTISAINLKRYYIVLTVPGNIIGFYLAIKINYLLLGFIFPVVSIMLWYYSSYYQKKILSGNIMIATLSALVILVLWLFEFFALKNDPIRFVNVFSQLNHLHVIVLGYAIFAFFVSLIREIAKDAEDLDGDKEGGFKTLPIVYGKKTSKSIIIGFHVFTMLLLGYFQYLLYAHGLMMVFWYVTIAVQTLFLFVLYFVFTAETKKEYHFLSSAYKIIMLAGILSMQLFYISF